MPRSLWLGLLLCSRVVFADCPPLDSPKAVISCALLNHPSLRSGSARLSQSEKQEDQASRLRNPELGSRAVFGKAEGESIHTIEVNLAQPIELGGKRSARIEQAKAEREIAEGGLLLGREEVFLATLKNLYRLRQLRSEDGTLEEALQTFTRIQKQYRSRQRLSPEQEVSLGVIRLAQGDYQLRRVMLESEKEAIVRDISLSIGQPFVVLDSNLPKKRDAWPEIARKAPDEGLQGGLLKQSKAEVRKAWSELAVAQGQSWPELKVGPSYESGLRYQSYGANLSLTLPIFDLNGAGRSAAQAGVERAEIEYSQTARRAETQRTLWVSQYRRALQAIAQSVQDPELASKHKHLEDYFMRGIVPTGLIIEAHRQIFDFTRSKNELELTAVDALWRVYALDGRMFEEAL